MLIDHQCLGVVPRLVVFPLVLLKTYLVLVQLAAGAARNLHIQLALLTSRTTFAAAVLHQFSHTTYTTHSTTDRVGLFALTVLAFRLH